MDILTFIIENQLTALKWAEISSVLNDHEKLIREMADLVLNDKAGNGDERKNYLGLYYDEVQAKVNWIIQTAEDVWAGKYGNNEERKEKLGDDYDVVMLQVNRTWYLHKEIVIDESYIDFYFDTSLKRYVMKSMPTALGTRTVYGFPQTKQGDNPYNFSGSGCGIASAYTVVCTTKGYSMTLKQWADKNLAAVEGTKCPISTMIIQRLFDRENIKYKRIKSFTTASLAATLKEHLKTGNPAILALTRTNRAGENHKGRYANSEHYATLTHMHKDGKRAFLLDSSGDPARGPRWVDLYDICDHVPTAREREDFNPIWNGWINCGGVLLVYMR
jgi:hypothetical protein